MLQLEPEDLSVECSEIERIFLRSCRFVPGIGKTASPKRLLTAFRGSAWTIAGYGGSQVLRLASMVILARHLLGPKAFGLLALVNVLLSGLALLSDLGIGTDVVQHPRGDEPAFINTAFLIQAGRGVLLWIIASAVAYPFAYFYHEPAIFMLAIVAGVSVLIQGFASGSVWEFTRHVQLREITLLRLGAEAVGLVVSIAWAAMSPTAWALVVGRVAAELFFTLGTHMVGKERVTLRWDSTAAKDILAFGAGMFASSATYFLAGESERLVIAKFISLTVLGCFSLAISISSAATQGVQRLIGQVFFPMIASSLRISREKGVREFEKARFLLLVVSCALAVLFVAGGPWIVAVLLGPKYLMAGWMLQLLGVRAVLELFTSATTQVLFALGTSKYAAAGNVAKLLFLAAGLAIAFTKFGFREAVWVLAISPAVAYIPLLVGLKRNFPAALRAELASFSGLVAVTVAAAAAVRFL